MTAADVRPGANVVIYHSDLVNLYGCEIGDGCKIGAFVEIRKQAKIGCNAKIQTFAFIPEGVTVEDGAFIGPDVCFTNNKYPRAINSSPVGVPEVRPGALSTNFGSAGAPAPLHLQGQTPRQGAGFLPVVNPDGSLMEADNWEIVPALVKQGADIGANATIVCGITIGEYAIVVAVAVVPRDVPDYAIVAGVPARVVGDVRDQEEGR